MDKQYVIQNLLNRYGKYGVSQVGIEETINKMEIRFTYNVIHVCLRMMFSAMYNTDELFTLNELLLGYGNHERIVKEIGISKKKLLNINADEPLFSMVSGKGNGLKKIKNNIVFNYKIRKE